MLELKNVCVYYRKVPALRDVSIQVGESEAVGILGRNGAGKTTTLKSIMGLVPVKSGQIILDNEHISKLFAWQVPRMGIGYVPQGGRVFPELTVEENLLITGLNNSEKSLPEEAYNLFPELKERKDNLASTLSGGEQQLLAIARAVITHPELILFDEPTEGLMPRLIGKVKGVIEACLDEGKAVLLAEQNLQIILELCHRLYVIQRGEIILEEKTENLTQGDLRKYISVELS